MSQSSKVVEVEPTCGVSAVPSMVGKDKKKYTERKHAGSRHEDDESPLHGRGGRPRLRKHANQSFRLPGITAFPSLPPSCCGMGLSDRNESRSTVTSASLITRLRETTVDQRIL